MNKIKALVSLLLISLTLTGCNVNDSGSVPVSAPDSKAENISLPENPSSSAESAPSVSSAPTNDNSSTVEYQPLTRSEWEQIISLFKEWSFLDSGIHPFGDDFPECVDKEQSVDVLQGENIKAAYYPFYKVVSGDCSTEAGFNKKLDGIFSEVMKEKYLASPMMNEYLFSDDGVYVGKLSRNSYINMDIPRERNASMTLTLSADPLSEDRIGITVTYGESNPFKFDTIFKRTGNGDFIIDTVYEPTESLIMLPVLFDHKRIHVIAVEGTTKFNFAYEKS